MELTDNPRQPVLEVHVLQIKPEFSGQIPHLTLRHIAANGFEIAVSLRALDEGLAEILGIEVP